MPSWISLSWKISCHYNTQINSNYIKTETICKHNKALMDMIIDSNLYAENEIVHINRYIIYLQVQNLSEITNCLGTHIHYCVISHIKNSNQQSTCLL